jgi:two-component sensor histidine kinase
LSVADNGAGLPNDFDPTTDSHLGLKLVSSLATQIGGELHSENRQGARFFVRFSPDKSQYRHSDQQGAS